LPKAEIRATGDAPYLHFLRKAMYLAMYKTDNMNKLFAVIVFCMLSAGAVAQTDNPKYDKALAEKLGGDDYGMKPYVFAILKSGPYKPAEKAVSDSLFRGHIQNITRLANEGKLVIAGPLGKNDKEYRGIFIFNVKTIEEANALLQTDPAVKAKVFDTEVFQWYGSAALPEYLKYHEKVEKKKF
jgi:uncharacterized protein YciI